MEDFYLEWDDIPKWLTSLLDQVMEETGKTPEEMETDAQRFRAGKALEALIEIRNEYEERADLIAFLQTMAQLIHDTHQNAPKLRPEEREEREPWEVVVLNGLETMIRELYAIANP